MDKTHELYTAFVGNNLVYLPTLRDAELKRRLVTWFQHLKVFLAAQELKGGGGGVLWWCSKADVDVVIYLAQHDDLVESVVPFYISLLVQAAFSPPPICLPTAQSCEERERWKRDKLSCFAAKITAPPPHPN